MNIGFIGLGNMGGPMALNLIKAGHALTVHDVRQKSAGPHLDKGSRGRPRWTASRPALMALSMARRRV
jgi:3-hydroxyisobutyrate dehydrogenase-like beta-hydroxyacid dehydrogenase